MRLANLISFKRGLSSQFSQHTHTHLHHAFYPSTTSCFLRKSTLNTPTLIHRAFISTKPKIKKSDPLDMFLGFQETHRITTHSIENTESIENIENFENIQKEVESLLDEPHVLSTETETETVSLFQEEANLEVRAVSASIDENRKISDTTKMLNRSSDLGPALRLIEIWKTDFLKWFNEENLGYKKPVRNRKRTEIVGISKNEPTSTGEWRETLAQLNADKVSTIAIHALASLSLSSTTEGVPVATVVAEIASTLRYEFDQKEKQKNGNLFWIRKKFSADDKKGNDYLHMAAFLLEGILATAKIESFSLDTNSVPESLPAFTTKMKVNIRNKQRRKVILCDENVYKQVEWGHTLRETNYVQLFPMVVPPVLWTQPELGGYLHIRTMIMRTNGSNEQLEALYNADLSNIYQGLNILGSTPWRINEKILDVAEKLYTLGGDFADLPSTQDLPLPEKTHDPESKKAAYLYKKDVEKVKQMNKDRHSLRCTYALQSGVAKEFVGKTIYFPHNVDFRGRAYPIPPHLNQMGSDFCRGLLLFNDAKPIGERGIFWLKVHLANLYGVDKVPFETRIKFVEDNMKWIEDSADDPIDGARWWGKADKPFQCLAASIELTNCLRSKDPTKFLTRLPIHQDGTCNGLQHYAALGGDETGARKVNVLPSDTPQDVYSGIAAIVAEKVESDASSGLELAKKLLGKITRKIVKQTVMTSVYGVTFIGARQQIENAMKEHGFVDHDFLYRSSMYLTKQTFIALNSMFLGARAIMEWLTECANIIAKSGNPVTWVTPIGLPVIQPYRKHSRFVIKTKQQSVTFISYSKESPISSRQQTSAFPPNFIHSLDSTHMFLTAIECSRKGITFASIHDSFWTHACDIDVMAVSLREKFIELHSQPILERLSDWFREKHPDLTFPDLPPRGALNLIDVKRSKYFFH